MASAFDRNYRGGAFSNPDYDQPRTPGLDRLEAANTRDPLTDRLPAMGVNSALSKDYFGGAPGAAYRRSEEAYGRALRQLRHASRRGDTGAALQEIAVRDQAAQAGYANPGGIRDRAQSRADMFSTFDSRKKMADDRASAEKLERTRTKGFQDYLDAGGQENYEQWGMKPGETRWGGTFGPGSMDMPWKSDVPPQPNDPAMQRMAANSLLSQPSQPLGQARSGGTKLQTTSPVGRRRDPFSRDDTYQQRFYI